jgi:hypothetical protein
LNPGDGVKKGFPREEKVPLVIRRKMYEIGSRGQGDPMNPARGGAGTKKKRGFCHKIF